ncbi:MAG: hypothetical protein FWF57_05165, partial [Defluviitaleaceae bacterium]|nr:hypothetical protein [Defluviitaleaceae bacterium]
ITATIPMTAPASDVTATAMLTVVHTSRVPTTIIITPTDVTVGQGNTQQFIAVVRDQFGDVMPTPTGLTWSATYNNVTYSGVTINNSGLATVLHNATVGRQMTITATIPMTAPASDVTSTTTLTVADTPRIPTTIAVTPDTVNVEQGSSHQFSVVVRDQFGDVMPTPSGLTWSATYNNATYQPVTINTAGLASVGANATIGRQITITATVPGIISTNNVTGTAILNVIPASSAPASIRIIPNSLTMPLGGFSQITAEVLNHAGIVITNPNFVITWSSDSHGPINVWYDSNFVFVETIPTETFHGQIGNITATLQGTNITATLVVTVDANINAPIVLSTIIPVDINDYSPEKEKIENEYDSVKTEEVEKEEVGEVEQEELEQEEAKVEIIETNSENENNDIN